MVGVISLPLEGGLWNAIHACRAGVAPAIIYWQVADLPYNIICRARVSRANINWQDTRRWGLNGANVSIPNINPSFLH